MGKNDKEKGVGCVEVITSGLANNQYFFILVTKISRALKQVGSVFT